MASKNQKFRHWTDEEKNEIIEMRKLGMKLKDIAKSFNSTIGTIGNILNSQNVVNENVKYSNDKQINNIFIEMTVDSMKYFKKIATEFCEENQILKKRWSSRIKEKKIKKS